MDLVVSQKLEVPAYLNLQLEEILKFSKVKAVEPPIGSAAIESSRGMKAIEQHVSLERFPRLSSLVSSLDGFRNSLEKQGWTQKSVEGKLLFPNQSKEPVVTYHSCITRSSCLGSNVVELYPAQLPVGFGGAIEPRLFAALSRH